VKWFIITGQMEPVGEKGLRPISLRSHSHTNSVNSEPVRYFIPHLEPLADQVVPQVRHLEHGGAVLDPTLQPVLQGVEGLFEKRNKEEILIEYMQISKVTKRKRKKKKKVKRVRESRRKSESERSKELKGERG
jgi:hypothetical protein